MDEYTACEQAYTNGYTKGYKAGKAEALGATELIQYSYSNRYGLKCKCCGARHRLNDRRTHRYCYKCGRIIENDHD